MKNYALVIPTNGPTHDNCKEAWKILESKYGISRISSTSPYPHITLAAGSTKHTVKEVVSVWKNRIPSGRFRLKGNGLGVFLFDAPTVYVR